MPDDRRFRRHLTATALIVIGAAAFPGVARAQVTPAENERMDHDCSEAVRLRNEGKTAEAVSLLEGTLARVKTIVKPGDRHIGKVMNLLGVEYFFVRRYKDAEGMFRDSIAIGRAQPGVMGGFRFTARDSLVQALGAQEKFDEALPLAREAIAEMESMFSADDSRTIRARDTLANVYVAAKRYDEAIPISRQALKSAESTFTAGDPETIPYRHTLASALMNSGKYAEAKTLFEASLAVARKRLPPTHQYLAATLNGLASCNQYMGLEKEAAAVSAEESKVTASRPGASAEEVVSGLNTRAVTRLNAGDYAGAEESFEKALEAARKRLPSGDPTTTGVLINFSAMLITTGRYGKAEGQLLRALDVIAKNPGRGTILDAQVKSTLGVVYQKTGRFAEAKVLLTDAYDVIKRLRRKGHPEIAYVRQNLATVCHETKDYKEAAGLFQESLKDVEDELGRDNIRVGQILLNVGQNSTMLAQYAEAEAALRRAAAIFAKTDPGGPGAAAVDNALAPLCVINGRKEEAEVLLRRTLATLTKRFGPEHPNTVVAMDNLTSVLLSRGRVAEAVDEYDRARRSSRLFLLNTLPAFQEDDQLAMIDSLERVSRDAALTLAVDRRTQPGIAGRSAEWVLNGKAITIDALATRAVLSREAVDPETAGLVAELTAAQNRVATRTFARPESDGPDAETPGDDFKALKARVVDLSRRINLNLRRPDDADRWVKLADARAALPADAVLVEFVRVSMREATVEDQLTKGARPPRYAAWVIPPAGHGEVTVVDLGPADALEAVVSDALRALQPDIARPLLPGNEPADEARALAALNVLSDRLYDPLRAHLEPAKRWVISPDAALWLVPWAALPVGDGRYAVEGHLIHLAVSGRHLLAPRAAAKGTPPAIFAAPDYDLDPGRVLATAKALGHDRAATRGGPPPPDFLSARFQPLPRTKDEAWAIAPLMAAYAGADPAVFLGAAASETVFKGLRGPRALVLSTHGFFLVEPKTAPPSPLLRCGLVLAGYNSRKANPTPGETDDGLLTGLEVVSADLRGTELVVLSACETGLGDVRAGEGVAGLRQVFQLAGAGGVVASLWSVQDLESYQLMSAFFHGLARQRGPASALREAQLALIRDRRSRLGAAHPTYWAAFALTGYPGPKWSGEALDAGLPPLPRSRPAAIDVSGSTISPVTGRPVTGPWPDAALAVVLFSGGGYAAAPVVGPGDGRRFVNRRSTPMRPVGPGSEPTRDADLADWRAFSLAYYESIARALRLLRVPEGEVDELAHSFLLKAAEKQFLDAYHAFRGREADAGRVARFRHYLYRSLQNHARDARRRQTRKSREVGLGPEAAGALEAAPERPLGPDAIHALDVLHQALQAFRTHAERTGKPHLWVFFEETFLADEFRGRRGKTRAELLAGAQRDDPQFLDNALTTAKRAFRRFVQEVIPRWPGDGLDPAERFADWMATLRDSNASQFDLLHLAYRVTPFLGDASQAASAAMVVSGPPGSIIPALVYEEPASALDDDELSILLSFRLEMPLARMLDGPDLKPYFPASGPFFPASAAGRRPLSLLTLIDPTEAEAEALAGVDVVGLLSRVKSLAKQLRRSPDPDVFAEVIYTAASALALVRYRATIHSISPTRLASNLRLFLGRPWLDDRLRPLFLSALKAAEGPRPDPS